MRVRVRRSKVYCCRQSRSCRGKGGWSIHRSLGLQLSSEADVPPLPDILTEASEGDAGLTNPVVDFSIDVHHSRECNNYNNNNLITYIVQVFIKMIKCASH